MNVSVLLGHPYEQSFNAAIAVAVVRTLEENGHTVRFPICMVRDSIRSFLARN